MRQVVTILLFLSLMLVARGALPPLSPQERNDQASDIVVATVMNVKQKVDEVQGGDDIIFELSIRVDDAKKGMLRPGLTLKVLCRQTGRRPEGWAGPQGQNEIPPQKSKVRLFLREHENQFFLLEPNGWENL